MEIPVSKECRPWSADLGLHRFPISQTWDVRQEWVNGKNWYNAYRPFKRWTIQNGTLFFLLCYSDIVFYIVDVVHTI